VRRIQSSLFATELRAFKIEEAKKKAESEAQKARGYVNKDTVTAALALSSLALYYWFAVRR
jgi:hypothetical protein